MELDSIKTGRKLARAINQLEAATNTFVEVGHFNSQGIHSNTKLTSNDTGLTYVELLQMWADGIEDSNTGQIIIQDVRAQFVFNYFRNKGISKDLEIDFVIKRFLSNLTSPKAVDLLLEGIGKVLQERYKDTFNKFQGPHMKGTSTPLYETGELKSTVAYKTSRDGTLKEN